MSDKDPEQPTSSFWSRTSSATMIGGAALAAIGALIVNTYLPSLLEAFGSPEPIDVRARYDDNLYGSCGWAARLPDTVAPDEPPPVEAHPSSVFAWVLEQGGAFLSPTAISVHVEGQRSSASEIVGITAQVAERGPPLTGPEIYIPCEGEVAAISLGFDLDEPSPVARRVDHVDGSPTLGDPWFSQNLITLAKDEPLLIAGHGFTDDSSLSWSLEVVVSRDGHRRTITPGGEAFRTTSQHPLPSAEWWMVQTPDGVLAWWPLSRVCSEYLLDLVAYDRCDTPIGVG